MIIQENGKFYFKQELSEADIVLLKASICPTVQPPQPEPTSPPVVVTPQPPNTTNTPTAFRFTNLGNRSVKAQWDDSSIGNYQLTIRYL